MQRAALITLGGSMSRFARCHFNVKRAAGQTCGTLSLIGVRSGAAALVAALPRLRQHELVVAVGFAGALASDVRTGDVIVVSAAHDCVSPNGGVQRPNTQLAGRLAADCQLRLPIHTGRIATVSGVLRRGDALAHRLSQRGLVAVDMEVACLLRLLKHPRRRVAAILVCSDHVFEAPLAERAADHASGLPITPLVATNTKIVLETVAAALRALAESESQGPRADRPTTRRVMGSRGIV